MAAVVRFLAGLALLVAVIFAVNDATHSLAGNHAPGISMHQVWSTASPASLKSFQGSVQRTTHPLVWTWGVLNILKLPAWALFGFVGLVLAFVGRRRRRVNIYAN